MSQERPDVPIWNAVLAHLSHDDSISPLMGGYLSLVVAQGAMNGILYLDVPDDNTATQIDKRLRPQILDALAAVDNPDQVGQFRVVIDPELAENPVLPHSPLADPAPASASPAPAAPVFTGSASRDDTRLNPKYSFDSFVIGQSNRLAHAAAFAVAESPAKAYNPLFIYGNSGLGKTHLLHAIGDYAINLYPGIRVRYVSSEDFTNDFINSIVNDRGSAFQARYREVDILLIDDIQFLQGKTETQEAFFHTFNTLHAHNKQVVITSDVVPRLLTGFEDRMRSRFEWGLITDVQAPDLETRIAILRKKATNENLHVPDDVMEYIATVASANIRELEGALIRVSAFSSLNRSALDIPLAKQVLRDIIEQAEANVISPQEIIEATAQYFQISVDDICGQSRTQSIANARHIAMYLCRERTDLSLPKIGQLFGGRDHTTIIHGYNKISGLMKERHSIYNQVAEITSRLGRR